MKTRFRFSLCLLVALMANASLMAEFYYQPEVGFVGDPIPFYDPLTHEFRIYYLQEFRPNGRTYHPIYAVETTDLRTYSELGEVLPTGNLGEQDAAIGTGTVIYCTSDRTYYFYYTGHDDLASSGNKERVLRATSPDGITWTKDKDFYISPSPFYYYQDDFRDPEVFRTDDGLYHMLVTTGKDGKHCLAEFTSSNCRDWVNRGVFLKSIGDRFSECPSVFKIGDWWYLVYSELHRDIRRVQYFKASTYEGLKTCTNGSTATWPDDHEGYLDSRGLYAAKTASDGTNRYLWGWCPTRSRSNNTSTNNWNGEPDWAGTMVCHRIVQHEDGTLTLGPVDGITGYFNDTVAAPATLSLAQGAQQLFDTISAQTHLSFTVHTTGAADRFGFSFCRKDENPKYYSVVVNPEDGGKRKINFEEEGEGGKGFVAWIDSYFFTQPASQEYNVDIYIDNSVLVLYINDAVCWTNRIYGMTGAAWSINCYTGSIDVTNIRQQVYNPALPQGLKDIRAVGTTASKVLYNGNLCILRNGTRYSLSGIQF